MSATENGSGTGSPGGATPASLDSTSSASADSALEEVLKEIEKETGTMHHAQGSSSSAPPSPSKVLGKNPAPSSPMSAARTPQVKNAVSDAAGTSESVPRVAATDGTTSGEAAAADPQGEAALAEMEQAVTGLLDPPELPRDFASESSSSDADPLHGGVMADPVISSSGYFTKSSDYQVESENDSMVDKMVIMGKAGVDPKQLGGSTTMNKLKRVFETTSFPTESLLFGSMDGCMPEGDALDSESSRVARQKMQNASYALREEIESINRTLIDTEITITGDSGTSCDAGTTIKLSYTAVALSQDLRSLFSSFEMCVVMPTKLYVPPDYPRRSPMLIIDKGDDQLRKKRSTISDSVHTAFPLALRALPEPHSIQDIAREWDTCVRKAVIEFAQQYGGGTFSSKFGGWERHVG